MTKILLTTSTILILFLLFLSGCQFASDVLPTSVDELTSLPSPTVPTTPILPTSTTVSSPPTFASSPTASATSTEPLPSTTPTATPVQIVIPSTTSSQQEIEAGLAELLKTNGNCQGKCLAGIRPEEIDVQEAVNLMSQWGVVSSTGTYFVLSQIPLHDEANISISVGTWTNKFVSIDRVAVTIGGGPELYIGEHLWRANQDTWEGFLLDGFLDTYGMPSYVGFLFDTKVEPGTPLEGRTISYGMEVQFEDINLNVLNSGIGYYDGETLEVCPDTDPHFLFIQLNPEVPLNEIQAMFRVTWEALTETDLEAFYTMFTNESTADVCITTTLEQIEALQPEFR